MASSTLTAKPSMPIAMDHRELDAARALLDVSPRSSSPNLDTAGSNDTSSPVDSPDVESFPPPQEEETPQEVPTRRPRSDSAGLEALAALASKEQAAVVNDDKPALLATTTITSSSEEDNDEDSSAMPPPPPRRRRSASNPEGMEKWDSLLLRPERRHFVLPASILEVELAQASAAVQEQQQKRIVSIPEESALPDPPKQENQNDDCGSSKEEDEANLRPEELLRRARSRLLEDLSAETHVQGEKGVLTLPHSLAKYKEVYNKNGRIGIYTPAERAAIIARFNRKRSRRVWNKKIRYNCRKSLADRRLRVKGRFVKRSEQEQLAKQLALQKQEKETILPEEKDQDMPDVNDPEAGFVPTDDQPYRRLRRHTIT